MSKISEYEDYSIDDETEVSSSEKEKFEDTGVIPVSGKYEANGPLKTKTVKLKDMLGGGGGGGGGGLTKGADITVSNEMIITPSGGTEYDNYLDITVTNNTYIKLTIPNGVNRISAIKLNITTTDLPNFVVHIKNSDYNHYASAAGPAIEVYYKEHATDTATIFDHSMITLDPYSTERAPLAYTADSDYSFTGDTIVTCIGYYFDIRYLYTHVPPSGSWNGIYS